MKDGQMGGQVVGRRTSKQKGIASPDASSSPAVVANRWQRSSPCRELVSNNRRRHSMAGTVASQGGYQVALSIMRASIFYADGMHEQHIQSELL